MTFTHRLRPALTVVTSMFRRYPLISNTLSTAVVLTLGDVLVQKLENKTFKKKRFVWLEVERAVRVFKVGCIYGVTLNYWYAWLDRCFAGRAWGTVGRKLLLDIGIAGPILIVLYIGGLKLLEGNSFTQSLDGVRKVFLPVYSAELVFWGTAQTINFIYVPAPYRTLYVAFFSFLWDSFLSYYHHVRGEYSQKDKITDESDKVDEKNVISELEHIK